MEKIKDMFDNSFLSGKEIFFSSRKKKITFENYITEPGIPSAELTKMVNVCRDMKTLGFINFY